MDDESHKAIRRGWCLGSVAFQEQMLERIEGKLGDYHSGTLRQESSQSRAERIVAQELKRLGWTEQDSGTLRKNDPRKLALAARLKKETTLSLKQIAARVQLGTSKGAHATLHRWMKNNRAAFVANLKPHPKVRL